MAQIDFCTSSILSWQHVILEDDKQFPLLKEPERTAGLFEMQIIAQRYTSFATRKPHGSIASMKQNRSRRAASEWRRSMTRGGSSAHKKLLGLTQNRVVRNAVS